MTAAAAVLILLNAAAALAMLALSVHGPDGLPVAAVVYLATAIALIVWSARRKSWPLLVGAGLAMLAVPPATYALLDYRENAAYLSRVGATRVSDVREELIVSTRGRPIGIRLTFSVSVPRTGEYSISPSLHAADGLRLEALLRTVDGQPESWRYEAGRANVQVAELYPPILVLNRAGGRCLWPAPASTPAAPREEPLVLVISATAYRERTANAYDLAQLYRNLQAEGLPPCKVSG